MRTEGKVSKVAICERCGNFVSACHVDHLNKSIEKEFTDFSNEGFIVKIETIAETKSRDFGRCKMCVSKQYKPK